MPLRPVLLSALFTLAALPLFTPAQADLTLEFTGVVTDASGTVLSTIQAGPQSGNPVIITTPSGANLGGVVFTGPLGATYLASGPGTLNNPGPANVLDALLDQITNTSGAVRNVTFLVSADGFTGNPASDSQALSGRFLNAAGSSITAKWYENPTNQLATVTGTVGLSDKTLNLNGSNQIGLTYSFTAPDNSPQSFTDVSTGLPLPHTSPFGMTLEYDLTLTGEANLQSFTQSQAASNLPSAATPVSGAQTVMIGLLGLGGAALLKKRREQAEAG